MSATEKKANDETQKQIFDKIANSDNAELKLLLAQMKGSVDFTDENGMSPLQHAAYKGNLEVVKTLIDQVYTLSLSHLK